MTAVLEKSVVTDRALLPTGRDACNRFLLPERLKEVQYLVAAGDERAAKTYATMGVWFGHAIAHYLDFHDFWNPLILGRVTTGAGGDSVPAKARKVLHEEFPEAAGQAMLHAPNEESRRVGQAVAAAGLPQIERNQEI